MGRQRCRSRSWSSAILLGAFYFGLSSLLVFTFQINTSHAQTVGVAPCDRYANTVRCYAACLSSSNEAVRLQTLNRKLKYWIRMKRRLGTRRISAQCSRALTSIQSTIRMAPSTHHCLLATTTKIPKKTALKKLPGKSCPRGYSQIGSAPPGGYYLYCGRYRGTQIQKHGWFITWYKNGKKRSEGIHDRFGRRTGKYRTWYKNGKKRSKVNYQYGKLSGKGYAWYRNGNRYYIATFSGGAKHGPYTGFHKNGKKSEKGKFVKGAREGRFDFWDDKGNAIKSCGYKNGVMQSCVKHKPNTTKIGYQCIPGSSIAPNGSYCPPGTKRFSMQGDPRSYYCARKSKMGILVKHGPYSVWKKQTGSYCNGRMHGRWTTSHAWTNSTSIATYFKGKLHGLQYRNGIQSFYLNGLLQGLKKKRRVFRSGCFYNKGKKDGCSVPFRSQTRKLICSSNTSLVGAGPPRSTSMWCEDNSGRKHGPYVLWHQNGVLKQEGTYSKGKRHGVFSGWTENGLRSYKGNYRAGRKSGIWSSWTTGEWGWILIASGTYRSGRKEGTWKYWHPNAALKSQGKYKKGLKVGSWDGYHRTAKKSYTGVFRGGKEHDKFMYWYDNGQKKKEGKYSRGKQIGSWRFYHSTGRRAAIGNYKNGRRHGLWREFYQYGQRKIVAKYSTGQKHGKYIKYYITGSKRLQGKYWKGTKHGNFVEYTKEGRVVTVCTWKKGEFVKCKKK